MSTTRSKETRESIAKLNAKVGARFYTEPLSEWSRKLLVFQLLLSAVAWLLFLGIVVPKDTDIVGTVEWHKPEAAALVAALTIIYTLILFKVSCEQDIVIWKFGNQPMIDMIKRRIQETHGDYSKLIDHEALLATQSKMLQEIIAYDDEFVSAFQKYDLGEALDRTAPFVTQEQGTPNSLAFYGKRLRSVDEHLEAARKLGDKREKVWEIQRTIADNNLKADVLMAEQDALDKLLDRCIEHMKIRERTQVWGPAAFACFTAVFILTSAVMARV